MGTPGIKKSFNRKPKVLAAALKEGDCHLCSKQETTEPQMGPQTHRPRPEVKTRDTPCGRTRDVFLPWNGAHRVKGLEFLQNFRDRCIGVSIA